jgi:hypothetical protein
VLPLFGTTLAPLELLVFPEFIIAPLVVAAPVLTEESPVEPSPLTLPDVLIIESEDVGVVVGTGEVAGAPVFPPLLSASGVAVALGLGVLSGFSVATGVGVGSPGAVGAGGAVGALVGSGADVGAGGAVGALGAAGAEGMSAA